MVVRMLRRKCRHRGHARGGVEEGADGGRGGGGGGGGELGEQAAEPPLVGVHGRSLDGRGTRYVPCPSQSDLESAIMYWLRVGAGC